MSEFKDLSNIKKVIAILQFVYLKTFNRLLVYILARRYPDTPELQFGRWLGKNAKIKWFFENKKRRLKMSKEITIKDAIEKIREYRKKVGNDIFKVNQAIYKDLRDLIPRENNPVKKIKPFCPECGQFMHLLEGITHVAPSKNEYLMKFVCRTENCELFKKPLRILFEIGEL